MTTDTCRFVGLALLLAAVYAVSAVGMRAAGIVAPIPWPFLLLLAIVAPLAWGTTIAARRLARTIDVRSFRGRALAACAGALLVLLYRPASPLFLVLVLACAIGVIVRFARGPVQLEPVWAFAALLFGYAAVWNGNYLALAIAGSRLNDHALRALDVTLFEAFTQGPVEYVGLFPIVRASLPFTLLENAYGMLFWEITFLLACAAVDRRALRRLVAGLFACYAAGLAVFLVFPAVGPCLMFPEALGEALDGTETAVLMQQLRRDYLAVQRAAAPETGFGYFVAFPSLHVALAVYAQFAFDRRDFRFWALLPVNVLLSASTVLLGWHYVSDVPGGLALGAAAAALVRARVPLVPVFGQDVCSLTRHSGTLSRIERTLSRRVSDGHRGRSVSAAAS